MPLFEDTTVVANRLAVAGLAASSLAIAYQIGAYALGCIPEHILPLVNLLSGTHEAIPVAYSWTVRLAVFSVIVFVGSSIMIICLRLAGHRLIGYAKPQNTSP
jgi:hypothetical protein